MKILCKLGLHNWTSDSPLCRALMIGDHGKPFGCVRCGARKDDKGVIYPLKEVV